MYRDKHFKRKWIKQNKEDLQKAGFEYELLHKALCLCKGHMFDLSIGTWHKKGDTKKVYSQGAKQFIRFIKKLELANE